MGSVAGGSRAAGRVKAARHAAATRVLTAAAAVRAGAELEHRDAREALAKLFDTAAGDGATLDIHTWERITHLADRVLAGPAVAPAPPAVDPVHDPVEDAAEDAVRGHGGTLGGRDLTP